MNENSYRGLATVLHSGFEIVVHADLSVHRSSDGGPGWGGHLQADRDEDFELMGDVLSGQVRLPDGREGDFVRKDGSTGAGSLEITGSGPAPF